jgi:hypothetical protein
MAKPRQSQKRSQLEKANARMVITVALAAFVVIFSLVASRALWIRMSHQAKVINQKEIARDQLESNLATIDDLKTAYTTFIETNQNVIGGNPAGTGDKDGDNAKIVLDALPSKYDFPGLATSLEKVIKANGSNINSISGIDDEVAQMGEKGANAPIEVPFEMAAAGNYQSTQDLLTLLQRSIRPIQVQTLDVSGSNSDLVLNLTALTYYQPERALRVQTKVVE